jgi:AcrR family transcriptional regulator
MSERSERTEDAGQRGYRSFLRLPAIVGEARRIADADGLSAVSMRSLAEALDCTPRALYRHVAGKDEVLELLADDALGELPAPRPGADWEEALVEFFVAMRALLVASPAIAEIVAQHPVAGPNFRAHGAAVAAVLISAGLAPDIAVEAVVALGQFTIGASMPGTGQRLHETYRALEHVDGGSTLGHVREHFVRDSAAEHFRAALRRLLGAYRPAIG